MDISDKGKSGTVANGPVQREDTAGRGWAPAVVGVQSAGGVGRGERGRAGEGRPRSRCYHVGTARLSSVRVACTVVLSTEGAGEGHTVSHSRVRGGRGEVGVGTEEYLYRRRG